MSTEKAERRGFRKSGDSLCSFSNYRCNANPVETINSLEGSLREPVESVALA
jgi:hypothetical protein